MNSEDKQAWPDLAGRALGGSVIYANDELFAERENLIKPEEPVFRPHTFGHKGQIMDGWETRRRREPGSDAAIVRLGCGGVVRKVVVDTSYFTGNYPPEVSVEACGAEGYPSPAELGAAGIAAVYPLSDLEPDLERCRAEAASLLHRVGQLIARDRLTEAVTKAETPGMSQAPGTRQSRHRAMRQR